MKRFKFLSAVWAGVVATLVMTNVMFVFELDLMEMLGQNAGHEGLLASAVGAAIHFGIGIFYALLYALIFQPLMHKLPGFLSGALYSLLPWVIALIGMNEFLELMRMTFDGAAAAPCAPADMDIAPWLLSLINHAIYGIVLGLVYRPRHISG